MKIFKNLKPRNSFPVQSLADIYVYLYGTLNENHYLIKPVISLEDIEFEENRSGDLERLKELIEDANNMDTISNDEADDILLALRIDDCIKLDEDLILAEPVQDVACYPMTIVLGNILNTVKGYMVAGSVIELCGLNYLSLLDMDPIIGLSEAELLALPKFSDEDEIPTNLNAYTVPGRLVTEAEGGKYKFDFLAISTYLSRECHSFSISVAVSIKEKDNFIRKFVIPYKAFKSYSSYVEELILHVLIGTASKIESFE